MPYGRFFLPGPTEVHPEVLGAQAEAQARQISAWWRENRTAAPDLFLKELSEGLSLLAFFPGAGARFRRASVTGVRRVLLRKTMHWIYYVHDEPREVIYVLAVWSAFRGTDPSLASGDS